LSGLARGGETAVLEVDALCVELSIGGRWVRALNNVSLTVNAGEVLGLVGESGSGKSLTALAVAGLLPANARVVGGSIRLCGEAVLGRSEPELNRLRGRALAFIFQNPATYLNPLLTIGAQIAEVFEVSPELLAPEGGGRLSKRETRERAWRMVVDHLRLVHISDPERIARQYPFELSGGMQQRAVIAMALIRRPSLVIADEITTALDVTVQAQILSLLSELRGSIGMTLLLITHDMGIVAQLADRVAVMYSGSVAESSDVASLFAGARHPYAKALLEAVPTIDGSDAVLRAIPGSIPAITSPPPGCRFHLRCPRMLPHCAHAVPQPVLLGDRHTVSCHLYRDAPT
jgi:oligopeptide/dipeptide ABC transporter ATP-binding protein